MSIEYVALKRNLKKRFTIEEFNRMSESERELYKGHICCPKCEEDAGYRKAAKDGKIACFFATHIKDCSFSSSTKSKKGEAGEETNMIIVDASTFGIQWNYKSNKLSGELNSEEPESKENITTNRKYVKNPPNRRQPKLTLNKILTYAEIGKLADAGINIKINGKNRDLSKCVYHVSEINDSMIKKEGFFWGEMKYYNDNFINLRDSTDVSILVVDEILNKFYDRFKSKFFKIQKSNLMVVYGKIIKTKTDKYLVVHNDVNRFYCRAK